VTNQYSEEIMAGPKKEILTKEDLTAFHASDAYSSFVEFIDALNVAVRDKTNSDDVFVSHVRLQLLMLTREAYARRIGHVGNVARMGRASSCRRQC